MTGGAGGPCPALLCSGTAELCAADRTLALASEAAGTASAGRGRGSLGELRLGLRSWPLPTDGRGVVHRDRSHSLTQHSAVARPAVLSDIRIHGSYIYYTLYNLTSRDIIVSSNGWYRDIWWSGINRWLALWSTQPASRLLSQRCRVHTHACRSQLLEREASTLVIAGDRGASICRNAVASRRRRR